MIENAGSDRDESSVPSKNVVKDKVRVKAPLLKDSEIVFAVTSSEDSSSDESISGASDIAD